MSDIVPKLLNTAVQTAKLPLNKKEIFHNKIMKKGTSLRANIFLSETISREKHFNHAVKLYIVQGILKSPSNK